jgi:signal transduction histidine kinase
VYNSGSRPQPQPWDDAPVRAASYCADMLVGRLRRPPVLDAALAVAVAVLIALATFIAPPGRQELDLAGYLLPLVAAVALVARRRAPVAVLAITAACSLGYVLGGYPGIGPGFAMLIALYTSVDAGHRLTAIVISGTTLVAGTAIDLALREGESGRAIVQRWSLLAGWLVAAKVLGEVSRHRRGYLRQVEQRALEAERTREETARRRAGEERLRIARELHDALAHSISVVKVQAAVAVHLYRKRGEPVPAALLAIQEASAEAMRELRATLDVLRADGEPGSGLDRLDELVDRARSAGLPAMVSVTGARRPLPAEVDRAAYRIVQEALTNVARHAGPATASVRIGYAADALTVEVVDDGAAVPDTEPVPGVGLTGMRERVSGLGGRLRAGPRPGGGFRVRAEIPVGGGS